MALKQKNKSLISRIISGSASGAGNQMLLSELLGFDPETPDDGPDTEGAMPIDSESFYEGAGEQDLGFLSGGTRDLSGIMGDLPGVDPDSEPRSALEGLDPAMQAFILEQFPELAHMLPSVSTSVRFPKRSVSRP
jgi:hypothetical protein